MYIYNKTIQEIKTELLKLPKSERQRFIAELGDIAAEARQSSRCQDSRRELLNNKQGVCPHCGATSTSGLVLKVNPSATNANHAIEVLLNIQVLGLQGFTTRIS